MYGGGNVNGGVDTLQNMEVENIDYDKVTGMQVNYYLSCKTKLWLYSHSVSFEHTSDLVKLGRLLHQEYFNSQRKDVFYNGVAFDVIKPNKQIIEVKRGTRVRECDIYQTLYYLYYLEKHGVKGFTAILTYPRARKKLVLALGDKERKQLDEIVNGIREIISNPYPPPPKKKKFCKGCAYYDFCFG